MPEESKQFGGEPLEVALDALLLDPQNPRLPPEMRGADQLALARFIDEHYDPIRVARSIATHGYFPSEPLILINADAPGRFVVVEGNRRLVALRGLADAGVRSEFEEPDRWSSLAAEAVLPDTYPAVLAGSRKDVAPIIGYRHISGIEPWDPLAKARFVTALIDDPDDQADFAEVAAVVGETVGDVRALYRNERIVRQARDDFGLDTSTAEDEFGVFTRAMNSPAIRSFIGAPAPGEVVVDAPPLPSDKSEEVRELITWIFGGAGAEGKVISESRDLTTLGRVLGTAEGLAVLRETANLDDADDAAGGPLARLVNRLTQGRNALRASLADIERFVHEAEVEALVDECSDLVDRLQEHR